MASHESRFGQGLDCVFMLCICADCFLTLSQRGCLSKLLHLTCLTSYLRHILFLIESRYEGEAEDLGLTFSVEDDIFGRRKVHELCLGGDDMAVTTANKLLYVHLVADWHLNRRLGKPAASFAAGLNQVGRLHCDLLACQIIFLTIILQMAVFVGSGCVL